MLKLIPNNVKHIGRHDYVADENNVIYDMDYHFTGNYNYGIYQISVKDGQKSRTQIKNPTQEQKEFALLNSIIYDNEISYHKRGIYKKSVEKICAAYQMALYKMIKENWSTEQVFEEFGIEPVGEYMKGAYNGLIKDILAGRQIKEDKSKLYYVERSPKSVDFEHYQKAQDGKVYVIQPSEKKYGYNLYQLDKNSQIIVKNPNQKQLENALLNVVIKDNYENPSKTGVYQHTDEYIAAEFDNTLANMQSGYCDSKDFMKKYGIEYFDQTMDVAVSELFNDTKNGMKHTKEEVL